MQKEIKEIPAMCLIKDKGECILTAEGALGFVFWTGLAILGTAFAASAVKSIKSEIEKVKP